MIQLTQLFLLDNQKDSVKQFPVLDEVVEIVKQFEGLGPSILGTDSIEQTMVVNDGEELFNHQCEQGTGCQSQEEVVELEEILELVCLHVGHKVATTKDDNKVGDTCCEDY